MFKKWGLMVVALLASTVFAGFAFTTGGETFSPWRIADPYQKPEGAEVTQENTGAVPEASYVLMATERPDLMRLTVDEKVPAEAMSKTPSADQFVTVAYARWGTRTIWKNGEDRDVFTYTLLGSDAIVLYMWEANKNRCVAFADGKIYCNKTSGDIEILQVAPFNNRIRITIYDADEHPLESRDFTVVGVKPAEPTAEPQN